MIVDIGGVKMKRNLTKAEYLDESYDKIEQLLETIDVKPYSDTLIGIRLWCVADKYGYKEANKLIDDLNLEEYGHNKVNDD